MHQNFEIVLNQMLPENGFRPIDRILIDQNNFK